MARFHGRRGVVTIGASALGSVSAFTYEESADSVEATAMGDTTKQYEAGLVEGSGTVDCRFDPSDTEQEGLFDDLRAGTTVVLKLEFNSANATTGEIGSLDGSVILTSYSLNQSFDDTVNVSFAFRGALDMTDIV